MNNFTTAILCAGGNGTRMNAGKNKLLLPLGGATVFEKTAIAFNSAKTVDEIIASVLPADKEAFEAILKKVVDRKPYKVVTGGKCREESVKNGVKAASGNCDYIAVHDAARPLITPEEIDAINEKAYVCNAVCSGVAVKNTVKMIDADGKIEKTLDRDKLFSAVTPQVFKKELLCEAFEKFANDLESFTDDSSMVEKLGYEVETYYCSGENIKITTPEDIKTAEKFLER